MENKKKNESKKINWKLIVIIESVVLLVLLVFTLLFGGLNGAKSNEINGLNKEVTTVTEEKSALAGQIVTLTNEKTQKETEIVTLTQEISQKNSQVSVLTTEKEELTTNLEEKKAEVKTLETSVSEKNTAITNLTSEKDALTTELNTVKGEKTELEKTITEKNTAITNLTSEKETLTTELNTVKAAKTELETELASVKAAKEDLESKLATATQDKETLQAAISEKEATITSLNQTITEKEATITSLNQTITEKTNKITELEAAKTQLETDLATANSTIETLNTTITEKTNKITELEAAKTQLETDLATANSTITNLTNTITEKETQITNLTNEKNTLVNEKAELTTQITDLNSQIDELTEKLAAQTAIANKMSVFYINDDIIKATLYVNKGEDVDASTVTEPIAKENYFGIWPAAPSNVEADTVVVATYTPIDVSLSGIEKLGETLTATYTGSITGVSYSWYRNDDEITGANTYQYVITDADLGKVITVKVTKDGYVGYTKASTQKITDSYLIDWNGAFLLDNRTKNLYQFAQQYENIYFGQTKDYLETIEGLDKVLVGETTSDLIYAYYDSSDENYTNLYILSDLAIKFEENDYFSIYSEGYYMSLGLFYSLTNVKNLVLKNIDITCIDSAYGMFGYCTSLVTLDISELDTSSITNMSYMFFGCKKLVNIDVSSFNTSKVTDMSGMFVSCERLTSITFGDDFDTSKVTTMQSMFEGCKSLTTVDVTMLDTSAVKNMKYMFKECTSLTTLDLSNFDTSAVKNMGSMFKECTSLTALDLSKFDTSAVENMESMFEDCSSLTQLDLSNFDTSAVESMESMFDECSSLTELDLSKFDTSNLYSTYGMFNYCSVLKTIYVSSDFSLGSGWGSIFYDCEKLVGGVGTKYSSDHTGYDYAIVDGMGGHAGYFTLKGTAAVISKYNAGFTLKINDGDAESITSSKLIYSLSSGDKVTVLGYSNAESEGIVKVYRYNNGVKTIVSLTNDSFTVEENKVYYIELVKENILSKINWQSPINPNFDNYVDSAYSFAKEAKNLIVGKLSDYEGDVDGLTSYFIGETENDVVYLYLKYDESTLDTAYVLSNRIVTFEDDDKVYNGSIFSQLKSTTIYIRNVDISNITNLSCMFANCEYATTIDITGLDASNAEDMSYMFALCLKLTSLTYTGLLTSNVTNMSNMFLNCNNITTITLTGLTTTNLSNMNSMFKSCPLLTSVTFGNDFDTSNVTNMSNLFGWCEKLETVSFGTSFSTSNVTNMSCMFLQCNKLTSLDLSGFDTSKVINVDSMLSSCNKLKTVYISDKFNIRNISDSSFFSSDNSLIGGAGFAHGTTSNNSSTYAIVDGMNGNHGYFTLKDQGVVIGTYYDGFTIKINDGDSKSINENGNNIYSLKANDVVSFTIPASTTQVTYSVKAYYYDAEYNKVNVTLTENSLTIEDGKVYYVDLVEEYNYYTLNWDNYYISKFSGYLNAFAKTKKNIYIGKTTTYATQIGNLSSTKTLVGRYNRDLIYAYYDTDNLYIVADKPIHILSTNSYSTFYQYTTLKEAYIDNVVIEGNSMSSMFRKCSAVTKIVFGSIDTSNVENMEQIFQECGSLTSIDVSAFDFSNVTNMRYMFSECSSLTSITFADDIDTSNVTNLYELFRGCSKLTSLDLSAFDTSNVTNMDMMFYLASLLKTVYVSDKFVTTNVTAGESIFSGTALVGGAGTTQSWQHVDKGYARIDGLDGNPGYFTLKAPGALIASYLDDYTIKVNTNDAESITSTSNHIYNLKAGDVVTFTTPEATTLSTYVVKVYYYDATNGKTNVNLTSNSFTVEEGKVYYIDLVEEYNYYTLNWTNANSILGSSLKNFANTKKNIYIGTTTQYSTQISSLSSTETFVGKTDKDLINAYYDANNLYIVADKEIYISGYNTFGDCDVIEKIFIDNLVISNASTSSMFTGCTKLQSVKFGTINTTNVTNMSLMFSNCENVVTIDLSGFNTSNVTDMKSLFFGCKKLTTITFSEYFVTDNVTDMDAMFKLCEALESVDLSKFDTSNVVDLGHMFNGCTNLKTIYASDKFVTTSVTSGNEMFTSCSALVGGAGTTYNSSNTNTTYAVIDGLNGNSGYFTLKGTVAIISANADGFKVQEAGSAQKSISSSSDSILALTAGKKVTITKIGTYDKITVSYYDSTGKHTNVLSSNTFTVEEGKVYYITLEYVVAYNLNWSDSTNETLGKTLKEFAQGYQNIYFGKTSDYSTKISGLTNTPVGKTTSDLVNAYYDSSKTNLYILADEAIGVNTLCMFVAFSNLKTVSFNNVIVSSNSMYQMFYNCSSLTTIIYGTIDTSNVIYMNDMICKCPKLITLSFGNSINTSNVVTMEKLITECAAIEELDLSSFDTSSVTNMSYMFSQCAKLSSINLSSFDTSNVVNMSGMFVSCGKLTSLDLLSFNTLKVTNMSRMFFGCSTLTNVTLGVNFKTLNVTNMTRMFQSCESMTTFPTTSFNTSNVTTMEYMFNCCYGVTSIDLSKFNFEKVTDLHGMFNSCTKLTSVTFPSNINTSSLTNMCGLFSNCIKLESVNLSKFNTSSVTDMSYLFASCNSLTTITFASDIDTSNVTKMENMFNGCKALLSLDLSKFDTSKVTNMAYMFYQCQKLTTLDVLSFNTSNVTDMQFMFNSCYLLASITFGENFKTSNVKNMRYMFAGNSVLTTLDLSTFDTSNVTNMENMFANSVKLVTIYVSNKFVTTNVTSGSDMFSWCSALVGGAGTTYSSSRTNVIYAKVDGGSGNEGYFTLKS